jgi:hypothetical protein
VTRPQEVLGACARRSIPRQSILREEPVIRFRHGAIAATLRASADAASAQTTVITANPWGRHRRPSNTVSASRRRAISRISCGLFTF